MRAEDRFYMQLRPQLEIEAPVGYHAASDPRTFAAILLLEDLVATKSATFCNHRTYVSRAMAEDTIDLPAALHASLYGDSGFATQYRWVAPYPRWFTIGAQKLDLELYTREAFEGASHVIPQGVLARQMKYGRRPYVRSRCTKGGPRGCFTRTSISAIGTGPAREGWVYATGSDCRAVQ